MRGECEVIRQARIIASDSRFYVEARVGSGNHRGECCRALYGGGSFNNRADDVIRLFAEQIAKDHPEEKPDWRIGLRVQPKYRDDVFYRTGTKGVIVGVFPSGTKGFADPNGVLEIAVDDPGGWTITSGADRWITA